MLLLIHRIECITLSFPPSTTPSLRIFPPLHPPHTSDNIVICNASSCADVVIVVTRGKDGVLPGFARRSAVLSRTVERAASEKNGPISNFQLDHNQSSTVILITIISAISHTNCQRPHNLLETSILWAIHAHLVRIISPHLHHHAIDSSSLPSPSTAIKLRTRIHTP